MKISFIHETEPNHFYEFVEAYLFLIPGDFVRMSGTDYVVVSRRLFLDGSRQELSICVRYAQGAEIPQCLAEDPR
jgi:hypothetical protein